MIKWFKQKVINWVREDWENTKLNRNQVEAIPSTIGVRSRGIDRNGMNFTLHSASGGYVMEYTQYDSKTDERQQSLHIITSDQDLGQSIAHIITLEMLRK